MAKTGAGQAVRNTWTAIRDETVLNVGTLNRIGDRQAEHIRLQNISQMSQGRDRNGRKMAPYKPGTIEERRRQGYQTGKVDLKRTGLFHDKIRADGRGAKVNAREGSATIEFTVTVAAEHEGRLEGFRTGKYGKSGRNRPRPVIGMADVGTALRTTQENQLKRIALQEYRRALGSVVTFESRDT